MHHWHLITRFFFDALFENSPKTMFASHVLLRAEREQQSTIGRTKLILKKYSDFRTGKEAEEAEKKLQKKKEKQRRKRRGQEQSESVEQEEQRPENDEENVSDDSAEENSDIEKDWRKEGFIEAIKAIKKKKRAYARFSVYKHGYEILPRRKLIREETNTKLQGIASYIHRQKNCKFLSEMFNRAVIGHNWGVAHRLLKSLMFEHIRRPKDIKMHLMWRTGAHVIDMNEELKFEKEAREKFSIGGVYNIFDFNAKLQVKFSSLTPDQLDQLRQFYSNQRQSLVSDECEKFLQWIVDKFGKFSYWSEKSQRLSAEMTAAFLTKKLQNLSKYESCYLPGERDFDELEMRYRRFNAQLSDIFLKVSFQQNPMYRYYEMVLMQMNIRFELERKFHKRPDAAQNLANYTEKFKKLYHEVKKHGKFDRNFVKRVMYNLVHMEPQNLEKTDSIELEKETDSSSESEEENDNVGLEKLQSDDSEALSDDTVSEEESGDDFEVNEQLAETEAQAAMIMSQL